MTSYSFGDVVLAGFAFTDLQATKRRPAVIVHSPACHDRPDVILMAITSQFRQPLPPVKRCCRTGGRPEVFTLQTLPASGEPSADGVGKQYRARVTPARRGRGGRHVTTADPEERTAAERRAAMTWAQCLKRVFGIDIETCPACGGAMRILACIEDPDVIEKIPSFGP